MPSKKYPHVSLPSLPRTTYSTSPQAHAMNTTNTSKSDWLFDSGASHHITNDLSASSLHAPYDGTDELVIGDGSSLTITHVGSLLLQFSTATFVLKNVLCVPSISRNIISISRLCIDNHTLIQFYSFLFLIKDFRSQGILLRGLASRGIYELRSTSPHFAFLSHSNKSTPWHHRLGLTHLRDAYGGERFLRTGPVNEVDKANTILDGVCMIDMLSSISAVRSLARF
ncbi:hypothetical protein L1887_31541 [Cichorium endivia]|nr:hypothetical protein L1887_31541 [Cichorium endivia]